MLALAVNALGIFLTWCRYTHHAAYLSIPVKVGRQHAQHAFRIEPVGLGPTGTPIVTPRLEAAMDCRRCA